MKWLDGSKFEGLWRNDQRFKGKMYMTDGSIYEGCFDEDKFHGLGTISMRIQLGTNKFFTGVFDNGRVPNTGKITLSSSKDVYYGAHLDYVREGKGYLQRGDGGKYEGMF